MDTLKELESSLRSAVQKFADELQGVRSNRPSVQLIEDVRVECYGEQMTVQQLGSLYISPPPPSPLKRGGGNFLFVQFRNLALQ